MKLKQGTLVKLSKITGISKTLICDYMAARKRPRPPRAVELEKASKKIGVNCPAATWLLGSSRGIRRCFLNGKRAGFEEMPFNSRTWIEDDANLSPENIERMEEQRPAIGEEMRYLETAKKIADQIIRNEASLDILSATPSLKETVMAMIESRTKQPREEAV